MPTCGHPDDRLRNPAGGFSRKPCKPRDKRRLHKPGISMPPFRERGLFLLRGAGAANAPRPRPPCPLIAKKSRPRMGTALRLSGAAGSERSRRRSSGRLGCGKRCRRNIRCGGRGPTDRTRSADTADVHQEIVRRASGEATRLTGGGYGTRVDRGRSRCA